MFLPMSYRRDILRPVLLPRFHVNWSRNNRTSVRRGFVAGHYQEVSSNPDLIGRYGEVSLATVIDLGVCSVVGHRQSLGHETFWFRCAVSGATTGALVTRQREPSSWS